MKYLLTGLLLLSSFVCVHAQRHLPDLQIFQTDEQVYLDTIVEQPAINQGVATTTIPARGENLSFQIFIPRAGGLSGFECSITFNNPDSSLTRSFEIQNATDWQHFPLQHVSSGPTISYFQNNLTFSRVPITGHIATIVLTPRQEIKSPLPIQMECTVTIVSLPPRRVWQMRGVQTLNWQ